jgi:hypothetical protein
MVTLNQDTEPHGGESIGSQDARQGMKTGYMRRVLTVSIVLAVVAMLAAWLWIARPRTMAPDTAHNAARVTEGQSANGGVLSPQDTSAAPGAPTTHVTPQADQPQTQN